MADHNHRNAQPGGAIANWGDWRAVDWFSWFNQGAGVAVADVGLAGFALRRERIEFLLEPFLGGFAGVDRATSAARISSRHRRPLRLNVVPREGLRATVRFAFNPKKSGPDHAVPVIFPARAESER